MSRGGLAGRPVGSGTQPSACGHVRDRQRPHAATRGSASEWGSSGERSRPSSRGSCPSAGPPPALQTRVACLGVACRGDQDRAGQDHGTRRPARKKCRHSLQRFTLGCRENRTLRLGVLLARLKAKLRGYDHDDGVAGNVAGLKPCFSPARGSLQTWRNVNRQLTQHLAVLRCCFQAATSWRRVSRVSAGPNIVPRGR